MTLELADRPVYVYIQWQWLISSLRAFDYLFFVYFGLASNYVFWQLKIVEPWPK